MRKALIFLLFISYALLSSAQAEAIRKNWKAGIEKLLAQDEFRHSQVAVYVYDLTDNKLVAAHNEQQLMRPASNQKIITSVAALDALGCDYEYATSLHTTGRFSADTLRGDLWVKAGYDPLFGHADMQGFVESLAGKGISCIEGNLWLDMSLKDTLTKGWGWCWDDDDKSTSPLCYADGENFVQAFVDELYEWGIHLDGGYGYQLLPDTAQLLCRRTHGITAVLEDMMKKSDNHHAESMFYQLAAHSGKPFASRKEAADEINSLIKRLGLNPKDYKIADGSGLSLYNYCTVELLGKLLRHAYREDALFNALRTSLPIAGVDGTLKQRMLRTPAYKRVWGKTGSVTAVSTLAGYLKAKNGHWLCFAIFNQGLAKTKTGRDFQDAVCGVLCK